LSRENIKKLISDLNLTIQKAGSSWPDKTEVMRILTEALNLIKKTCGENSDHYIQLKTNSKDFHPLGASIFKGIIEAANADYRDGFVDIDSFIRAEIFEDFLSMAEYLLEQGYYVPAASLAGGVLEDSLRKLCDKHAVSYPPKTKINSLNISLAKAGVYNALVSKEIISKADIRNNADHGYTNKFSKTDVNSMVEWIRRFIIEYL